MALAARPTVKIEKHVIPITREAERIVYADREEAYDDPRKNFARIAKMWSGILNIDITPQQVGLCQMAVKIARESYEHKEDNLVDICGYALCVDRLHQKSEDTDNA
jgi:hypothetical protein